MPNEIEESLAAFVKEVISLRYGVSLPPSAANIQQVLESLADVRKSLDRVEQVLIFAIQLKGRAHQSFELKQAQADDAWAAAVRVERRAPAVQGAEFTGPRERYAEADLKTLTERRDARVAKSFEDSASTSLDVIKIAHRGLDGLRQDHLAILRAAQVESSLERP